MANNVAVTTLEIRGTEKVATTMKELKEQIKSYRDELVVLGQAEDKDEKNKEQQIAVIERLQKATKLLSDVTNAHKKSLEGESKEIDIATASYRDLQSRLTELKKAYKDMTAAERDSQLGTDTLQSISQLDVKLKDLDAGMGVYSRNVGNYGKTFEESMDQARQSSGYVGQALGTLTGTLALMGVQNEGVIKTVTGLTLAMQVLSNEGFTKVVVKIKEWIVAKFASTAATQAETTATVAHATAMTADAAATTAATTATNGFKKALIATGIGAIVVAIGSLIAYWDELTEILGLSTDATKEETAALEAAREAAQKYRTDVGNAASASISQYAMLQAQYKSLRTEHEKRKWIEENAEAFNDLGISVKDLNSAEEAFISNTDAVIDGLVRRAVATAKQQQLTELAAKYIEEMMAAEEKMVSAGDKVLWVEGGVFKEGDPNYTMNPRSGRWEYTEQGAAAKNEESRNMVFRRANAVRLQMEELAEELATDFADIVLGGGTSSSGSGGGSTFYEQLSADFDDIEALIAAETELLGKQAQDELSLINYRMEAAEEEKMLRKERIDGLHEETMAVLESNQAQIESEKAKAAAKKEAMQQTITASVSIMNSLADILESNGQEDEKAARRAKGLRIASTTIETISGATSAFMSAFKSGIPAPFNMILATANASAVLATGMANIAKMKATPVNGGSSGGGVSTSASVTPPNIDTQLQSTRNVTSASEEELLNRMASPQKVYILQSDIEAANAQSKAQVQESSF